MKLAARSRLAQGGVDFYPEEQPIREIVVRELWVDEHPVTNAEFRRFVKDAGYVTVAEHAPEAADLPDADDWKRWWRCVPGADWRHPVGPESTLDGLDRHPVVHVAYEDAKAYAVWAGKRLPTEGSRVMASIWHGQFPWRNERPGRWTTTSPIGSYPPNGYGLFEVCGNTWEWTNSAWTDSHAESDAVPAHSCCAPNAHPDESMRMVTKGGSHICAPSYCHRYRPAARQGQSVRSSTSPLGFRCVRDA